MDRTGVWHIFFLKNGLIFTVSGYPVQKEPLPRSLHLNAAMEGGLVAPPEESPSLRRLAREEALGSSHVLDAEHIAELGFY